MVLLAVLGVDLKRTDAAVAGLASSKCKVCVCDARVEVYICA